MRTCTHGLSIESLAHCFLPFIFGEMIMGLNDQLPARSDKARAVISTKNEWGRLIFLDYNSIPIIGKDGVTSSASIRVTLTGTSQ